MGAFSANNYQHEPTIPNDQGHRNCPSPLPVSQSVVECRHEGRQIETRLRRLDAAVLRTERQVETLSVVRERYDNIVAGAVISAEVAREQFISNRPVNPLCLSALVWR